MFVSWFRMCPNCPTCGLHFDREPQGGYWVGSYSLNLFATEMAFAVAFVGALVLTWPDPPWAALAWGGLVLMVGFPIIFFPWSKTLFIAIDLIFRPDEPEDYRQPEEPTGRGRGKRTK